MLLPELNKEILKRLYHQEQQAIRKIAEIYGCSPKLVRYRCIKYGITLRPKNQKRIKAKKEELQKLYHNEGKAFTEIAQIF